MFLIRPIPKKNENLLAYMLRVTWLNHLRCLHDLLIVCGLNNLNRRIPFKKFVNGQFDLSLLAHWLKMDTSLLNNNSINTSYKFTLYSGHDLPSCMLDFSSPSFCLECLREGGFIKSIGAIKSFSYCLKHNVCYANRWLNGEPIRWNSQNFWQKVNEANDEQRTPSREEIELNEVLFHLYIGNNTTRLREPLHLLNLKNLLLLLRFVVKFHPKLKQLKPKNSPHIWVKAFSCLLEWPIRIHNVLNYYENNPMCDSGAGIRATYRDIYDELYSSAFSSTYAYICLQQAYEEFISRVGSTTPLWSPNFSLIASNSINKITSSALSKTLGIRESALQRLIELKLLKPKAITSAGVMLFDKDDANKFELKFQSMICLTDVCRLLKVSRSVVTQLADIGFLPYIAKPTAKWRDWIFNVGAIEDSIHSLKCKAKIIRPKSNSFNHQTFRANNFRGQAAPEIITNMQTGILEFEYVPNIKHPLSLKQFRPISPSLLAPDTSKYATPDHVANELHININAIYEFIKKGFLKAEKVFTSVHTRRVLLIHKSSIDEFNKRFVLKPHSKQNLICVSGPSVNGGIVNVYQKISGGNDD